VWSCALHRTALHASWSTGIDASRQNANKEVIQGILVYVRALKMVVWVTDSDVLLLLACTAWCDKLA